MAQEQVTTQARVSSDSHQSTAKDKLDDHINKLSFDLVYHAEQHTLKGYFNTFCAECIYWAAKVAQHPEVWQEEYAKSQARYLRAIQPEIINYCIAKINENYNLPLKAREMTVQEYLQVAGQQ